MLKLSKCQKKKKEPLDSEPISYWNNSKIYMITQKRNISKRKKYMNS